MKRILLALVAMLMVAGVATTPVRAMDNTSIMGVEASILTKCAGQADGKKGEGIMCILGVVVDIFSALVAVLGVLGITIVGIQYLTAGGNEEQMRKAKTRMLEIVIGLILFAALYSIAKWLLPNFKSMPTNTGGAEENSQDVNSGGNNQKMNSGGNNKKTMPMMQ